MKKNLLLFITSLILIMISIEVFLRLAYPQNLNGWFRTRDESGLEILRKDSYFYHRNFGRSIKYTFGENNDRITNNVNKKKEDKILILGDSFTFGWLVNDEFIFVNLLQDFLVKSQIINPSAPGWGTADYTRYLENYCEIIKPNKTIIMLNTDDFGRSYNSKLYKKDIPNLIKISNSSASEVNEVFKLEYQDLLKKFSLKIGKDKPLVKESKFHKIPLYKFLIKNSHSFFVLRQAVVNLKKTSLLEKKSNYSDKFDIPSRPLPKKYKSAKLFGKVLFIRLREIAKNCGTELNVVYSGWYNYKKLPNLDNPTIYFLKEAEIFFKENKINYFDLTSQMVEMHKNPKKYIITYDNHPNELGHKIISKNLINLFKKKLIK